MPSIKRVVFILLIFTITWIVIGCDVYTCLYPSSSLVVSNYSKIAIIQLQIKETQSIDWEQNLLSKPLLPDASICIDELPKRIIDVRIIFENGIEKVVNDIELSSFEIYEVDVVSE